MNWAIELAQKFPRNRDDANLYGVIVYSSIHGHVSRMLQDDQMWAALDEASGPHWVVFAATATAGRREYKGGGFGITSLMVSVWKEPAANRELLADFGLRSTEEPYLVVFAERDDGKVLATSVALDDSSLDAAFNSLRKSLKHIASALEGMFDENRRVEARAFDVVEDRLWQDRQIEFFKIGFKAISIIKGLIK